MLIKKFNSQISSPSYHFADYLLKRVKKHKSVLVVGLDPQIEEIPDLLHDKAQKNSLTDEDFIHNLLTDYYRGVLIQIAESILAIKPNIAFFEQFGIGGLRAFATVISIAKELKVPIIADIKRGDIGSTATAYANAYLPARRSYRNSLNEFAVDAITISPFLGLDSLSPIISVAKDHGKGVFILVKTSNEGSKDLQDKILSDAQISVSQQVAEWITSLGEGSHGESGYSLLGAVVGATFPEHLAFFRSLLTSELFLIPGVGSQGGAVQDIAPAFSTSSNCLGPGAVVNVSRGIFKDAFMKVYRQNHRDFSSEQLNCKNDQFKQWNNEIINLVRSFNQSLQSVISSQD
jgi:orotidine-5'-phosphate decarboxylase